MYFSAWGHWPDHKERMTDLVSPSTLSIVASVLSLTSLVLSGLHCACRKRAGEPTVLEMEFQPEHNLESAHEAQAGAQAGARAESHGASLASNASPGASGMHMGMPVGVPVDVFSGQAVNMSARTST
jgi:hypothetical protein